jgi:predicted nuclease of predicted toxin-antitoxin system
MKILIDMNLPPRWASFLAAHGISASHWSVEGDMKAPDSEIPSVTQVRTQDVTPEAIGSLVLIALEKHREALDQGALLSIQRQTSRVRVLPINCQANEPVVRAVTETSVAALRSREFAV